MFQPPYRFLLDLPHPFTGQVKLFTDLFQRHRVLGVQAEVKFYHIGFPLGEGGDGAVDLLS
jgi:hypothetical protein